MVKTEHLFSKTIITCIFYVHVRILCKFYFTIDIASIQDIF